MADIYRYVLSPTHLHEFKSADRIYTQPPVMSLYLPDQKLGSRSQPGSSSHKFVIKGRQTGSMHRGHTWVFRAETYETMLAWFDDIKTLTEKTGEERNAFVRRHASTRSTSAHSARSASSDGGLEEDEADAIPYSANQSVANQAVRDESPQRSSRPSPGGRFPSDLMVNRNLQAPLSPSSGSSEIGNDLTTAAGGPQPNVHPMYASEPTSSQPIEPVVPAPYAQPAMKQQQDQAASLVNPYPPTQQGYEGQSSANNPYDGLPSFSQQQYPQPSYPPAQNAEPTYAQPIPVQPANHSSLERHDSNYGNWMAPAVGGAAAGALATEAWRRKQAEYEQAQQQEQLRQQSLQQQHHDEPPRSMAFMDTVPTPAEVPERHPDHVVPDNLDDTIAQSNATAPPVQPTTAPVPIVAAIPLPTQTQARAENEVATPASTTTSFLDESEVGASAPFGKTLNGGPVLAERDPTAQGVSHPGVIRQNTDISISELHVPGEYPKVRIGGSRVPMQ